MDKQMNNSTPQWVTGQKIATAVILFTMGCLVGFSISEAIEPERESTSESSEVSTVADGIVSIEVATFEEVTSEEITDVPTTEKVENIYYDCPLSHDLQDYIRELCNENGIPMSLVIAMIDVESSFNPDAISSTDDYGLMQINKCNHGWLREQYGITDVLDPYQNVRGGIIILSQHYNGNLSNALMSYNLGAGGASELWNEGVYSTSYSRKVISTKEVYDAQI